MPVSLAKNTNPGREEAGHVKNKQYNWTAVCVTEEAVLLTGLRKLKML